MAWLFAAGGMPQQTPTSQRNAQIPADVAEPATARASSRLPNRLQGNFATNIRIAGFEAKVPLPSKIDDLTVLRRHRELKAVTPSAIDANTLLDPPCGESRRADHDVS
jgi:hypothetical protein